MQCKPLHERVVLYASQRHRLTTRPRRARDNRQLSLADLLRPYPAQMPPDAPLPEAYLTLPLQTFVIQPVTVGRTDLMQVGYEQALRCYGRRSGARPCWLGIWRRGWRS